MPTDQSERYPRKLFYLLNCAALICTLIIILLSAHIRLGESGLGCDPWPACYTHATFHDATQGLDIPEGEYKGFRALHRLFASVLGIIVVVIMIVAVWYRQAISPLLPILMFLIVLFLSVLGVSTPTRSIPAITLGNVLGGIVLLALVWRQLLALRQASKHPAPHKWLLLLSLMTMLQIVTGIWASANYTASACPNLLSCDFSMQTSQQFATSFDLTRELELDIRGELIFTPEMNVIQFFHRLVSVALLLVICVCFYVIRKQHPALESSMRIVVAMFIANFLLGVFNILMEMPLWTGTLHNLLAAALMLAVINLVAATSKTSAT